MARIEKSTDPLRFSLARADVCAHTLLMTTTNSKREGTKGRFQIHRVVDGETRRAGWTGHTAYTAEAAQKMAQRLAKLTREQYTVVDTMTGVW